MKDRNGNRDLYARTYDNRGRFDGGGEPTNRHPSDLGAMDYAFGAMVLIVIGLMIAGVTVWADVPFGGAV